MSSIDEDDPVEWMYITEEEWFAGFRRNRQSMLDELCRRDEENRFAITPITTPQHPPVITDSYPASPFSSLTPPTDSIPSPGNNDTSPKILDNTDTHQHIPSTEAAKEVDDVPNLMEATTFEEELMGVDSRQISDVEGSFSVVSINRTKESFDSLRGYLKLRYDHRIPTLIDSVNGRFVRSATFVDTGWNLAKTNGKLVISYWTATDEKRLKLENKTEILEAQGNARREALERIYEPGMCPSDLFLLLYHWRWKGTFGRQIDALWLEMKQVETLQDLMKNFSNAEKCYKGIEGIFGATSPSAGHSASSVHATNRDSTARVGSRALHILIYPESKSNRLKDGLSHFNTSRLNLVDLAGSERQKLTGCKPGTVEKMLSGIRENTFCEQDILHEIPILEHMDTYHLTKEIVASDMSVLVVVLCRDEESLELKIEAEMLEAQDDGGGEILEQIYERHDALDIITVEKCATEILIGLGFDKKMQANKTRDFSGCWSMRIALAGALFMNPTIVLLDEPTDHLYLEDCVWLEEMWKKFELILVVLSHSQDFLNGVCINIIPMQSRTIKIYSGNYDQCVHTHGELEEYQMKQCKWKHEQIANMKEYIAQSDHGFAKLARQAQSKRKTLVKSGKGELTEKVSRNNVVAFRFINVGKLPPPILQFVGVSFCYTPEQLIYKNIEFGVDLDSRVALVGPDEAGKCTMSKLMTWGLRPTEGMLRRHNYLKIVQFHQHMTEKLDMELSALAFMKRHASIRKFVFTGKTQVVSMNDLKRCKETLLKLENCSKDELPVPSFGDWNPHVLTGYDNYLKIVLLPSLPGNVSMYFECILLGIEVALTEKYIHLHPSCSLLVFGHNTSWVVFGVLVSTSSEYLSCVTAFDFDALLTLCHPPLFCVSVSRQFDSIRSTILKKFCGKLNTNLGRFLMCARSDFKDERLRIQVNVGEDQILVLASLNDLKSVSIAGEDVVEYERKVFMNECLEKHLYVDGHGSLPLLALSEAKFKHLELKNIKRYEESLAQVLWVVSVGLEVDGLGRVNKMEVDSHEELVQTFLEANGCDYWETLEAWGAKKNGGVRSLNSWCRPLKFWCSRNITNVLSANIQLFILEDKDVGGRKVMLQDNCLFHLLFTFCFITSGQIGIKYSFMLLRLYVGSSYICQPGLLMGRVCKEDKSFWKGNQ